MSTHIDIDFSTLPHKRLSDPVKLLELQFNQSRHFPEESSSSKAEGVPAFLDAKREVQVSVKHTGSLTAVVFWFDLHLYDSLHVNTSDSGCHWKQAAIMMPNHVTLMTNQILTLFVSLKNSCIRISTSPSTY